MTPLDGLTEGNDEASAHSLDGPAGSCVDQQTEVSTEQQSVTGEESPTPTGAQDVPDPDTEPPGPRMEGPPMAGPPIDLALLAAQQAYVNVLLVHEVEWELADLSDDDRNLGRAELKNSMLGDWL